MAVPSKVPGFIRLISALGLLLIAVIVAGGGGWQLARLERTHLKEEILYPVTPRSLQAWLKTLDINDPASADRLADRILLMSLPQRRDVVISMSGAAFFAQLNPKFTQQRTFRTVALKAVLSALAKAPLLGDLWFLAANLRGQLFGIDPDVQQYLGLSFIYAPKEVDLVLARLQMMGLAWPLLSEASRNIVRDDLNIIAEAYPDRVQELRQYLKSAGAGI